MTFISDKKHHVVIVGGGTAGITVAARLKRADPQLDVAIIEPSDKHYYQPIWTLVGGGVFPKEVSQRDERDYIPQGVTWIRDAVTTFQPDQQAVTTRDGQLIAYDYLVVAPGIQIMWETVKGLKESLGAGGVCSNYSYDTVDYTWQCLREFKGGRALFTLPNTAIKCGGAPQKIMYLAADYFRRRGILARCTIEFVSAGAQLFSVAKYARALENVVARYGIQTRFRHNLVEIRADAREAVFKQLDTHQKVVLSYDMIHVTPPMGPPECVRHSPLANQAGWVEVHPDTLQHVRYEHVFSISDASSLPTSKTGAAIRKQAPVLVANLLAHRRGQPLPAKYNGYTSCPVVTGYGRLVLAEFDYHGEQAETFPFDQSKERYSMWLLKKYALPWMYWNGMLRGWM